MKGLDKNIPAKITTPITAPIRQIVEQMKKTQLNVKQIIDGWDSSDYGLINSIFKDRNSFHV